MSAKPCLAAHIMAVLGSESFEAAECFRGFTRKLTGFGVSGLSVWGLGTSEFRGLSLWGFGVQRLML